MVALICFVLAVLASPFKSNSRLEVENAVLRHQLIILQRKVRGRAHLTNNDRWFFVQMYRWFPSILKVVTIIEAFTPDPRRASPSLGPGLDFRYTQEPQEVRCQTTSTLKSRPTCSARRNPPIGSNGATGAIRSSPSLSKLRTALSPFPIGPDRME